MQVLLQKIVEALVDNPSEVRITKVEGKSTDIFELRVAKSDIGKVIGKKGRTADSIRNILIAASAKARTGKRAVLEIVD